MSTPGNFNCRKDCQIIRDVRAGWGDNCLGLTQISENATETFCQQACCADIACTVWQYGGSSDGARYECWTGEGSSCRTNRSDSFVVSAGQRLSHGHVTGKTLLNAELGNSWCSGAAMLKVDFQLQDSDSIQSARCRDICYSDGQCGTWQYSMTSGCWHGNAESCSNVVSPDTTSMTGGERLTRTCGAASAITTGAVGALVPDASATAKILGVLGLVLAGVLVLLLICCCSRRGAKGGAKKRAVKLRSDPSTDNSMEAMSLMDPMQQQMQMQPMQQQQFAPNNFAPPMMQPPYGGGYPPLQSQPPPMFQQQYAPGPPPPQSQPQQLQYAPGHARYTIPQTPGRPVQMFPPQYGHAAE